MTATAFHGTDAQSSKTFVLVSTIVVLIISTGSHIARICARKKSSQKLRKDDWMMLAALPFSWVPAVCLLYGLTVGLGDHQGNVSASDFKKFNISLFILQRGNPPCLFCVKTSILLLYVRLFPTPTFRKVAWVVWGYTAAWAIAAFFSNLNQCTPISYFWDKNQPGFCIPNALINIGLTNGVLSFAGDFVILIMPMPMIWKLKMDRNRKIAVTGMFLVGIFVCVTSILRFVALANIDIKDITYTQVDPGVWTYVELGTGITCGNLPLLRPLFRRVNPVSDYGGGGASHSYYHSRRAGAESLGSEVELRGITVKTDVELAVEEAVGEEGVKEAWETRRLQMLKSPKSNGLMTNITAPPKGHF